MLFKRTQDICSSFNITFVWSTQPVPAGCEGGGGEEGGKIAGGGCGC